MLYYCFSSCSRNPARRQLFVRFPVPCHDEATHSTLPFEAQNVIVHRIVYLGFSTAVRLLRKNENGLTAGLVLLKSATWANFPLAKASVLEVIRSPLNGLLSLSLQHFCDPVWQIHIVLLSKQDGR
jgi:hypothetical protein